MKCDIYKSELLKGVYIFVPAGVPIETAIPIDMLNTFGNTTFFITIDIKNTLPPIFVNATEIIKNIETKGFHVQKAKIRLEAISEVGAALGGGILLASFGFGPIGAIVGAAAGYFLANASKEDK